MTKFVAGEGKVEAAKMTEMDEEELLVVARTSTTTTAAFSGRVTYNRRLALLGSLILSLSVCLYLQRAETSLPVQM